jgi:hypothetical protein
MHMGDQRVPAAGPAQLVEGLDGQDGTGGADRVAEGDTAAVGIGPVRQQAELLHDGERLGRERLVDLEQVDVVQLEVSSLEYSPHRGHRSDAHDPRLDAGVRVGD